MRLENVDSLIGGPDDELLTTGEAARLLNTSRQHVVDLCDRGDLPFVTVGSHRRIRRSDIESLRSRTQRLTRDQQRSLWLGYAIAGKLATDPSGVMHKARSNLRNLKRIHSRGVKSRWLNEWDELLQGPAEAIMEILTARTPRARELRQNSPFAGVLTANERETVLAAFQRSHQRASR